jgi:hypothetical protein
MEALELMQHHLVSQLESIAKVSPREDLEVLLR